MVAAEKGNTQIASFLLDKGADVNARNDDGTSPLMVRFYEWLFGSGKSSNSCWGRC